MIPFAFRGALALSALAVTVAGQHHPPQVTDAWARPQPDARMMSALYFVVRNPTSRSVTLTAVSCGGVAMAHLHQTVDSAGVLRMVPLDSVAVPARDSVAFRPRGMHVMLMGLSAPLAPGGTLRCTAVLSGGQRLPFTAAVRAP